MNHAQVLRLLSVRSLHITAAIGLLLSATLQTATAQICLPDTTPLSTPVERFTISADGNAVRDKTTGLIWQRCALGQSWNSAFGICQFDVNKPIKYTWGAALTEAAAQATATGYVWRVPNLKEVISIVDFQCMGPAANLAIFPDTPASLSNGFWTSTPYQTYGDNPNANIPPPAAWFVITSSGQTGNRKISTVDTNFVRLVCGSSPHNYDPNISCLTFP